MSKQSFCTNENIESCVKILCSELEVLNFPLIHHKENNIEAYVHILNILWMLIKTIKSNLMKLNDLTEKYMCLQSKYKNLEENKKKLNVTLEDLKCKHDRSQELFRESVNERNNLKSKIRDKDIEIKKLESSIRLHKLYSKNYSKRREQYIEGLQSELLILTEMYKSKSKLNFKVYNSKVKNSDESCHNMNMIILTMKKYIYHLQDKIQKLGDENVNLRGSFLNVYCQFLKLRSLRDVDKEAEYLLKERLINLPLDHIINDAEQNVNKIMEIFERDQKLSDSDLE